MVASEGKVFRAGNAIYRCLSELGKGQTATVYRANREDCEGYTRKAVALKVLNKPEFVQNLRREFDVLDRMNANFTAKVLAWEIVSDGDQSISALALEWIDGVNIVELQRSGKMRPEWANEICAQIEVALQTLEANGLFHGDLSPANVMIDRRGQIKLVDFASDHHSSNGTLNYIAPEIWSGSALSIESDLFALGVIHHDLSTCFSDVETTTEAAKNRNLRIARGAPGFLTTMNPDLRDYANFERNSTSVEEMAKAVAAILDKKMILDAQTRALDAPVGASDSIQTPVSSVPKLRKRGYLGYLHVASLFFAVTVSVSVAVQAQAPRETANPVRGVLSVVTQSWFHLWLNGRDLGYSPVRIQKLLPGTHRLRYQSAKKTGEIQINLSPGAEFKLKERDFSKLE